VLPETIEQNLVKWFKLAENWGAIMLIDEADIYMEQRQVQDVERNHLVAGFLHALEYYKGILFLTTNRVGTFDEAFISRIHVQIYYPEFEDEQRAKIWDNVFEKLEEERETTMRILQATKDYTESEDIAALKWNGREIRNGKHRGFSSLATSLFTALRHHFMPYLMRIPD
jgi:SpoVK/Ycf46/Vps4 family AAA+-type ATPase